MMHSFLFYHVMESGKFAAKIHRRIVLLWFASVYMIPCRIHQVKMTVIFHALVSSKFIYRILFKLSTRDL